MEDYFLLLNAEQKSAVTHIDGPVLILAGAGTGKTRTITSRIAHIIKNDHANSDEILAVTFTNKAAKEMVSRVVKLTGSSLPWLGTFHAMAAKILRHHTETVGLKSNFTIIDIDDQLQVIKSIIKEVHPERLPEGPKVIVKIIQQWKEKGMLPSEVKNQPSSRPIYMIALKVYRRYQEKLRLLNSVDFGDLLMYNIKIFEKNTGALSYYQNKFKYIMVDEYQDTNMIQYRWLKYLATKHSNICCVGDDDQSIYGWRGAEIENILKFSHNFENTKTVKLECNYRSTSHILATALHVISHNKSRLGKTLWTKKTEGEKVTQVKLRDGEAEASFISQQILKLKYGFGGIAVLVRAIFQTRILEESFMQHSIPYKIVSGLKFYDRQEIKDIIAYLRLITNNSDDLAFVRIVNRPKRSIGATTLKKAHELAEKNRISLFEAAKALTESKAQATKKIKLSLNDFLSKIEAWGETIRVKPLHEFVEMLVNESGYIEMLKKEGETGVARLENVKELIASLYGYNNSTTFLEHISLVTDADNINNENAVYVMTLHAAKGLEFPCVFLPGWEEGIFPNHRSLEDRGGKALEEERRLAYVGITRAKEKLIISHVRNREMNSQWQSSQYSSPSQFIKELPKKNVEVIDMH